MTHRPQRFRSSIRVAAAALALAGLAGSGAAAPGPGTGESVPAATTLPLSEVVTQSSEASAGLRAFIDPDTGELTTNPSPEQLQRFVLAARLGLSRSFVGLRSFALDRGGRGVNLQGRFQSALRVERAPDGTFRTTCGDPAHADLPAAHENHDATHSRELER